MPPAFPSWNKAIDLLYLSPPFVECDLGNESRNHYKSQLEIVLRNFIFPLEDPEKAVQAFQKFADSTIVRPSISETEYFEKQSALNAFGSQFTLIGDATQMAFIRVSSNVKEVLKLDTDADFHLARVCGFDENYELYNPYDVFHIIRLGECALQASCIKGIQIKSYEDVYKIEFRMGFKDSMRYFTVIRKCWLSDPGKTPKGGIRHVDVWSVTPGHDQFSHVRATLSCKLDLAMNEVLANLFFVTNCTLLRLKPRDVLVANYMCKYSSGNCRNKLNEKAQIMLNVEDFFVKKAFSTLQRNVKRLIDSRMVENTKGAEFKKKVLDWSFYLKCGQLGILNIPSHLETSIWRSIKLT